MPPLAALLLAAVASTPAFAKTTPRGHAQAPGAQAPPARSPPKGPLGDLARGYRAYRAGDYAAATKALAAAAGHGLRVDDWAVYFLAESEFYSGS